NDGTTKAYVRHVPVTNILPKIDVRVSKSTGLAPLTVSFDASGSTDENGTIVDYQWIFPNDVTKTGPLADFIFEQKGEYDVMLRVTDNNADTVESSTKISVVDEGAPMAVVDTIPSPPQGQIPLMVKFAAGRSYDPNGNIVRYEWNFGDGSERENGQNANHVFDKEGTYVVRLTVWDNSGMEKASQAEVKVLKKAIKPIGVISLDKGQFNGIVPLTLGLNAGYSRDEDGSIVSYQWDFGDGSTSATGQKAEHTYSKIGQYELSMTITDNDGLSTTKKQIIKVRAPEPTPPIVLLSTNPDPAAINVGDEMTFNASRSYDLDGHIISYEWNFGDKVVRLGSAEITHKYDHTGIYKVQVTAYDNSGKTSRAEVQVAVSEPNLIAKIEADQTSGLVPLVVQFGVTGNANTAVSYEWDFGDGLKSSTRSPLHIFTKAGEYSVRLKAADSAGIVSEDVMLIEVKERD
ncbi:MAG: PKD domain-containing protein, partial [Patescibacteria group bacterium]|nr:PKD domain-containing protein [Patescibacteria group bacterium]